jgi:hypothetical protein
MSRRMTTGGFPSVAEEHRHANIIHLLFISPEPKAMLQTYEGGCHCGQVRIRVQADLTQVSTCNCSICTKKGILHLIVPLDRFELLQGEAAITTYTFGSGVAKHTFCRHCGIHAFYTPRSDPDKVSVNAHCLDGVDQTALHPWRQFDGQNWEAAMQARQAAEAERG